MNHTPGDATAPRASVPAYQQPIEEVLAALGTDAQRGLSQDEGRGRLERYGPNELAAETPVPGWRKFLAQFEDVLVILLLIATAISGGISTASDEGIDGHDRCCAGAAASHYLNVRYSGASWVFTTDHERIAKWLWGRLDIPERTSLSPHECRACATRPRLVVQPASPLDPTVNLKRTVRHVLCNGTKWISRLRWSR
jgi:hypothetical protein